MWFISGEQIEYFPVPNAEESELQDIAKWWYLAKRHVNITCKQANRVYYLGSKILNNY